MDQVPKQWLKNPVNPVLNSQFCYLEVQNIEKMYVSGPKPRKIFGQSVSSHESMFFELVALHGFKHNVTQSSVIVVSWCPWSRSHHIFVNDGKQEYVPYEATFVYLLNDLNQLSSSQHFFDPSDIFDSSVMMK